MSREDGQLVVPVVPRSSSPVTVYVEFPCVVEHAFSTIAWDDFEESSSVETQDISPACRATDCDSEDHVLDYVQEFRADSPGDSNLSPAELVPFHGCVIPPLTPQSDFFSEDSGFIHDEANVPAQNIETWEEMSQYRGFVLGCSADQNHKLHKIHENKQGETEEYKERNCHLKQLASRAKHLAAVLEKLTTVSEPNLRKAVMPHEDHPPALSPCKRQRLDEGYETETDLVDDMLRDISTRCDAMLHRAAITGTRQSEDNSIRTFGSFSGLQTCFSNTSEKTEAEKGSSFKVSVREHGTIKTQVFAHGHAFTTRTQRGGYCFRWVPNQS
ncbi:multicilin [Periophthalmus magnuspinnatus]|uniref:multicilin n=1 Tax=Periophthalmus magnuspinnatus TaxID=409849 RepID=UPI00145B0358|nr:multicilin [Periophthalmus magnuspinnatus]